MPHFLVERNFKRDPKGDPSKLIRIYRGGESEINTKKCHKGRGRGPKMFKNVSSIF